MDARHKEVGARVAALIVVVPALWRWAPGVCVSYQLSSRSARIHIPAIATAWRGTAGTRAVVAAVTTGRPAAVALITARFVCTPNQYSRE